MKTLKVVGLSVLLILKTTLSAQNPVIDTLTTARGLIQEKKFERASELLANYNSNHHNVEALRLQAQLLYWLGKVPAARRMYEKVYSDFPNNPAVLYEYGKFLYENNNINKSRQLLDQFIAIDSTHIQAMTMLAYIDLWSGNISSAKRKARWLQSKHPGHPEAKDIIHTAASYTSPYLKLTPGIYSDDQPLKRSYVIGEAGVYLSWLLSPYITTTFNRFQNEGQRYSPFSASVGNKIFVSLTKTAIELSGGVFSDKNQDSEAIWKVKLTQKILPVFSVYASTEKKPYQFTVSSIENPFSYALWELGLNFDRKQRWLGSAAFERQRFGDTNSVYTLYAWLLAPIINKNKFNMKAGYAFTYADAESNTFRPVQNSLVPIANKKIDGVYDPYFTPSQQSIHALLASINVKLSNMINFSSGLNVGVFAKSFLPYLFIDRTGTGPFFINKKFSDHHFTPVEFSAELKLYLTSTLAINSIYKYNSMIFYKSHSVSFQLRYIFSNAGQQK